MRMWQSSWQTTSSSTHAGASRSRHENDSVPRDEHEPQRVRWSRTASAFGSTPIASAWRSIEAASASRAELRYQRSSAVRRARAVGARSSSAPALQPALARPASTMRSWIASPPCHATPGRARPSASGCWRASARSSQGASVASALVDRALAARVRERRARARRPARARAAGGALETSAAPAPSPLRCAGAPCARPPRQADYAPCVRSRSPSRWRCTAKARAGSRAPASWPGSTCLPGACSRRRWRGGATRVIDIPGPVAAIVRPRAGGGLVVATETGVVLLDEDDEPTLPVRGLRRAGHPHERRRL